MKWDPDAWHNALALQALLVLYLRTAGHVGRSTTTRTRSLAPARSLTDRQKRILALAAQGKSTSSIAARLGFSESTVKQDIRRAVSALGVTNRQQAIRRAQELSFIASS